MKKSKVFNNISKELQESIPKLKRGEVKTFLMLNGVPNPDPDPREASKEPILYGKKQIRTNFRIYDEFQKEFVSVGAVETWNGDEPERFFLLVPGMDMGSRFQGKFSLTGGVVKDEELWEVLYLSPEREGTPCKDESIPPLFRLLDFKAETKQANTRFDILQKAIDIAKNIKQDKAKEVMAALNQPTYQEKDVLLSKTKDFARLHPDQFIQAYESKETPVKAIIRTAVDANVLDHEFASGKVRLGGVEITTLKTETTESFVSAFAQWINTAENGKSVLNNIESHLEKAKEITAA